MSDEDTILRLQREVDKVSGRVLLLMQLARARGWLIPDEEEKPEQTSRQQLLKEPPVDDANTDS